MTNSINEKVNVDSLSAITATLGEDTTEAVKSMGADIQTRARRMLRGGSVPKDVDPCLLKELFDEETRPGYSEFQRVLHLAYHQTAFGKGSERHGSGKDWTEQSIMLDGRECGPGSMAFQVQKKAKEAIRLANSKKFLAARTDILGAIVYAVAQYLLVEEVQAEHEKACEDDD